MDANAIDEAKSISEVVDIINGAKRSNDTRSSEAMAAQHAWDAAEEAGYITDLDIETHLDFLAEYGAKFHFCAAFEQALALKEKDRKR